ncbi:hypothetical protein [Mycobacteroides abscessus]|uniref:hypothetical protein n=1 Tax=Mycobacteroides abscessus TaxID=36809 RepID=UPI0005EA17EA|nr:hypothetical protein [Mycobacteroides abscessus]CPR70090.1 Uncharacterised protein [Mycobacteroides abscessus]CPU70438.1 Uncharacterised protein [Mycobacteroides abscessus]
MARFVVTDPATSNQAAAELPGAGRRLASVIVRAAEPLAALDAADTPQQVLDALVLWQRSQARIDRARAEVLRQLSRAGASTRGLGNELSLNRATVDRLIAAAEAEQVD